MMKAATYQEAVNLLKEQSSQLQLMFNQALIKDKQIQILQQALLSQQAEIVALKDLGNQWKTAKGNMKLQISKLSQSLDEKNQFQNKNAALLKQIKRQCQDYKQKYDKIRKQKKGVQEKIQELEQVNAEMMDKLRESSSQGRNVKSDLSRYKTQSKSFQSQLQHTRQKAEYLAKNLAQQQTKVRKLQEKVKQLFQENKKIKHQNAQLQAKLKDGQAERRENIERKKKQLQKSNQMLQRELFQAKNMVVQNEIYSKEEKCRQDSDLAYFSKKITQKKVTQAKVMLSHLKDPLNTAIKQFDKLTQQLSKQKHTNSQLESQLSKCQDDYQALVFETCHLKEQQTTMTKSLKQDNEILKLKLQQALQLSKGKDEQNARIRSVLNQANLRARDKQREIHQKLLQIQNQARLIFNYEEDIKRMRDALAELPKLKLSQKICQYIIAECVRLFMQLFKKHVATQKSIIFYKQYVFYYIRVSKQICTMVNGPKKPSRFRVVVWMVIFVKYLRKKCIGRSKNQVDSQIQELITTGLNQRIQCQYLKRSLQQIMCNTQSKNNLGFISAVREVSGQIKSMSQQNQFLMDIFAKYVRETGFQVVQKSSLKGRVSADLTLRINRSLGWLSELNTKPRILTQYRSVQNSCIPLQDSQKKNIKAGRIYGRRNLYPQ